MDLEENSGIIWYILGIYWDFRGKSKGYFWETLGFRGKMSQVFRRQKLKMMGYPMELLHEMIVLISKNVVFRSTMGCQGDLFQRPSRKIADETWIFLGFNDFSTNKPWLFCNSWCLPWGRNAKRYATIATSLVCLTRVYWSVDVGWIKWGFAKENESSAASNPHVLRNQDVACFVTWLDELTKMLQTHGPFSQTISNYRSQGSCSLRLRPILRV